MLKKIIISLLPVLLVACNSGSTTSGSNLQNNIKESSYNSKSKNLAEKVYENPSSHWHLVGMIPWTAKDGYIPTDSTVYAQPPIVFDQKTGAPYLLLQGNCGNYHPFYLYKYENNIFYKIADINKINGGCGNSDLTFVDMKMNTGNNQPYMLFKANQYNITESSTKANRVSFNSLVTYNQNGISFVGESEINTNNYPSAYATYGRSRLQFNPLNNEPFIFYYIRDDQDHGSYLSMTHYVNEWSSIGSEVFESISSQHNINYSDFQFDNNNNPVVIYITNNGIVYSSIYTGGLIWTEYIKPISIKQGSNRKSFLRYFGFEPYLFIYDNDRIQVYKTNIHNNYWVSAESTDNYIDSAPPAMDSVNKIAYFAYESFVDKKPVVRVKSFDGNNWHELETYIPNKATSGIYYRTVVNPVNHHLYLITSRPNESDSKGTDLYANAVYEYY